MLHFRDFLAQQIRYPRRNRDYSLSQMLLALIYPIVVPAVAFLLSLFLMPETRKISIWQPADVRAGARG